MMTWTTMKSSLKLVVLLVCVFLWVQYTVIHFTRKLLPGECQDSSQLKPYPEKDHNVKSSNTTAYSRKHILIFSQTRSGSSFTGQLFNQNPDIFYMYEPLFHPQWKLSRTKKCLGSALDRIVQLAKTDLLFNLYTCDLHSLEAYIQPEAQNHLTASLFRRSASNSLCTPPVCQNDKNETMEWQPDENWCDIMCRRMLNLTLASMACQSRSHVSIKTVRIYKLSYLRLITESPQLDLKIIHLVRDPRAILVSRMTLFPEYTSWKIWNNTGNNNSVDLTLMIKTCQNMEESVNTGLRKPAWLRGRYVLVRYEDLALNPIDKAKEIYKFLDLDIDSKVLRWLSQNTNDTSSKDLEFSTTRDSKSPTESWRLNVAFDIIKTVQNVCNNTLALLGYKIVQSEEELRNISNTLLEPMSEI